MLNKDALVHLQQTAIDAIGVLQQNAPDNTAVLPDSHNLHDLQKFQPLKRRFTGTMSTTDLADFIGYTKAADAAKRQGFIDADKLSCTMFFDLGNPEAPGHAEWKAKLALERTAAYDSLLGHNGKRLDQTDLTNWLEDWGDYITPISRDEGATYGTLSKAIQAIRKITIKASSEGESSVGDFAATRTSLEQVEASSKLELPAGFTFTCVPYLGLPTRWFRLRLQVLTASKDVPILVLRVVQLEAEHEAIVRDFKSVLQSQLADHAELTIGTFTP